MTGVQTCALPIYADDKRDLKAAIGRKVIWTGKAYEWAASSDRQGKTKTDTVTYLLQSPDAGSDEWPIFVVDEGTAKTTLAAEKLSRTSGDPSIRKVSGTISKIVPKTY